MRAGELTTPALLADAGVLDHNVAVMSAARPGAALRPHVKAFKCTALAGRLDAAGHHAFCCATVREMEGMAAAGLGADLLLANEVLDAQRLGALADAGTARVTVAVDSTWWLVVDELFQQHGNDHIYKYHHEKKQQSRGADH